MTLWYLWRPMDDWIAMPTCGIPVAAYDLRAPVNTCRWVWLTVMSYGWVWVPMMTCGWLAMPLDTYKYLWWPYDALLMSLCTCDDLQENLDTSVFVWMAEGNCAHLEYLDEYLQVCFGTCGWFLNACVPGMTCTWLWIPGIIYGWLWVPVDDSDHFDDLWMTKDTCT